MKTLKNGPDKTKYQPVKPLKSPEQTIKELKAEIKTCNLWMKRCAREERYDEAMEYKETILTLGFVIELIKGNCD